MMEYPITDGSYVQMKFLEDGLEIDIDRAGRLAKAIRYLMFREEIPDDFDLAIKQAARFVRRGGDLEVVFRDGRA